MYRRASRWLCLCLWFGCAAPEDKNPAQRCNVDSDCPGLQACYRGYCLGDADGVVSEEPWSSSGDGDSGAAGAPPVIGEPKDAVAPPSAQTDAGSAGSPSSPVPDAATPPAQAPVKVEPAPTAPTSEAPISPGKPASMPTKADAGTPPATPPAAQPPASPPPKSPPNGEPPAEAGSLLGALIEAGLAPTSMLVCVPACLAITQQKECERCIDRVLMKDRGENPCAGAEGDKGDKKGDDDDDDDDKDDPSNGADDPLCAVWSCARGKCRGGT